MRSWSRGSLPASVIRLPQTLLDVSGAHGDINPVPGVIFLRKTEIHRFSDGLFLSFLVLSSFFRRTRHLPFYFEPLEAVKESPELAVLRTAGLDVVMLTEKDLVQLGSTLPAVPVPDPAVSAPFRVHICSTSPPLQRLIQIHFYTISTEVQHRQSSCVKKQTNKQEIMTKILIPYLGIQYYFIHKLPSKMFKFRCRKLFSIL